jgi:uncharacterized integral membrane protein
MASIRMGLLAGTGALVLLVIFIVQNAHAVHITFVGARARVSLAAALLAAAIAGALVMAAAGTARSTRLRRTTRRASTAGHAPAPASDTRRDRQAGPAPVGADYSVTGVELVPSAWIGKVKFSIRLREGRQLRHFRYSCHHESPTSQCCRCSAGWPCSPGQIRLRTPRS